LPHAGLQDRRLFASGTTRLVRRRRVIAGSQGHPYQTQAKAHRAVGLSVIPPRVEPLFQAQSVIPALVAGIQPSANAGASREMGPGHKARDDNYEFGITVEIPLGSERY